MATISLVFHHLCFQSLFTFASKFLLLLPSASHAQYRYFVTAMLEMSDVTDCCLRLGKRCVISCILTSRVESDLNAHAFSIIVAWLHAFFIMRINSCNFLLSFRFSSFLCLSSSSRSVFLSFVCVLFCTDCWKLDQNILKSYTSLFHIACLLA